MGIRNSTGCKIKIPNIIHFVFGLKKQTSAFLFVYYLAVYSAKLINTPDAVYFHYHYEPYGEWWEKTKGLVVLKPVEIPTSCGNHEIVHYANKTDLLRLLILYEYGGVYFDIDTISIRPYHYLLKHTCVMGKELDGYLCNAVILCEPNSKFIRLWIDEFDKYFKPNGWSEVACSLPYALSETHPELIHIVPENVFFRPYADKDDKIFVSDSGSIDKRLVTLHLWKQYAAKHMEKITGFAWGYKNAHTLYGKIMIELQKKNKPEFRPSDSHSPTTRIPDHATPVRSPGFVMMLRAEDLILWSMKKPVEQVLNHTAALIWLLCDGRLTVAGIGDRMKQIYPEKSERIDADLPNLLGDLYVRSLIRVTDDIQPVKELYHVGFTHLWPGFNRKNNYFLWMLTHKFDVMLVDPRKKRPDILFYSNDAAENFDHHRIDRARTQKILCAVGEQNPNFSECDYAFSIHTVDSRFADRNFQLPAWSLFLDWDKYERAATSFHKNPVLKRYHPKSACSHLYYSLFSSGLKSDQNSPGQHGKPMGTRIGERAIASHRSDKKLTIGMATYDDFDGVYFTVQALRLYHPEVMEDTEILIVDNNPEGSCADPLSKIGNMVKEYRYIPYGEIQSTAARDMVFREARTPYVMCVDSHVLLVPGTVGKLITYLDTHPDCMDLLQGPLIYDDLKSLSTHFKPVWSDGMYGVWETDDRGKDPDSEPFDIPMQGLGLFACRRKAWLGFNPRFLGFGGEEGYIHEKFRKEGRRTLCLPFLRWIHRFNRPSGTHYSNTWEDRIRNYSIGFQENGLNTGLMEDHFREHIGKEMFDRIRQGIKKEMDNPFFYFDAIYCINLDSETERWKMIQERFRKLGILNRVRRFSAIKTPESHQIGCALSHRTIIEQAQKQNLNHVMVFEDDAIFLEDTLSHLKKSINELKNEKWHLLYLGGHTWNQPSSDIKRCCFLEKACEKLTTSHALSYHHSIYEKILADLPGDIVTMKEWIAVHHGIDQYLGVFDHRLITSPVVASQPALLPQEAAEFRDKFTL